MAGDIRRGFLAGIWGVFAMVGITFIIKRIVEPDGVMSKYHYEKVVEAAHEALTGGDPPLDDETRIKVGEVTHLAFGGWWGAVYAVLTRNRSLQPWRDGVLAGTALWLFAFGGYMPKLGLAPSIKDMGGYQALRTWTSHVTFSIATFMVLKSGKLPSAGS